MGFLAENFMKNWDKIFIDLSIHISQWSKDANKKYGAVLVSQDHRIISTGYNGFPQGCDDSIESRYERPQKYMWTEHAERNVIYSAAKIGVSTNNSIMYINGFSCADCARAIIQSGIKKVVCFEPDFNHPRWGEMYKVSFQLFKEAKIEIVYYKVSDN